MEEQVRALEIVNVMEIVVRPLVDQVLREEQMCTCQRCRLDVMAIALNSLPPQYVVSEEGKAYETCKLQGMLQNRVAVYQAILQAVQMVKQRPHHNRDRGFEESELQGGT